MKKNLISIISLFLIAIVSVSLIEPAVINAVEDTVLVNLTVDSGISITTRAVVPMYILGKT